MNGFFTEPIIIAKEQSAQFLNSLRRPDEEYLQRRDAIWDEMDKTINIQRNGNDMDVEIQGLDLSFIDEMDDETEINSWTINVKLEIQNNFKFFEIVGNNSSLYINSKDTSVMHEAKESNQLEKAA